MMRNPKRKKKPDWERNRTEGIEMGAKKLEVPSLELLEAELKKEQYKKNYGRVLQISGTSMTETLQNEDIVVAVSSSKYKTGDVIAFYYNNNILVKRVIASAGDWVDIDKDGNVFVNDEPLNEPYISEKALGDCNIDLPYQVPEGKCFVMGDHRATSIDSRNTAVGCVGSDMVVGRILLRAWPLSEIGFIK